MLSSNDIQKLVSYKEISLYKETMYDFYRRNCASEEILSLVKLENKRFGTVIENIIAEYMGMENPNLRLKSYDRLFNNLRFEIKSSRIWRGCRAHEFRWQHIMKDHDYDVLLLVAVDFTHLQLYAISKKRVMDLYYQNVIKQQGGAEGQGLWFSFSQIKPFITDVGTREQMIVFCEKIRRST